MSKRKRASKSPALRRVTISVCLPVSVTATVTRASDGNWEIDGIERVDCDASARSVMEAMGDDELDDLDRRANAAEDLP